MKKTTVIMLAAVLAGVTVFESCKKYEDGPSLSFRSRKERVANTWKADKYLVGGVEQTPPNGTMTFDKDGAYSATYTSNGFSFTITGTWQLTSNDENIETTYTLNNISTTSSVVILKLKEKELWIKDLGNDANSPDDDKETHLIPA